jgi:GTP-binding protein
MGVADLLDKVVNSLPDHWEPSDDEAPPLRVAILGRPNAGKSTLVNSILGEERVVVSDIAGTTRDAIDTPCVIDGKKWILTDTAGLRKKARVKDDVEYYSNQRALEAIRRCDVCVLLIDTQRGMEIQDFRICEQVFKAGRGLVIGLNKWDAIEKGDKTFDHMVKALEEKAPDLEGVPFVSLSGLTGQRVHRLLSTVEEVYDSLTRILGRDAVAKFLEDAWAKHPHPTTSVGPAHLTRACQVHVLPPAIAFEVKNPERVLPSYIRFLKRQALEAFGLKGVPLGIWFRNRFRLRSDEDLRSYLRRGARPGAADWSSEEWESEEETRDAEEFPVDEVEDETHLAEGSEDLDEDDEDDDLGEEAEDETDDEEKPSR